MSILTLLAYREAIGPERFRCTGSLLKEKAHLTAGLEVDRQTASERTPTGQPHHEPPSALIGSRLAAIIPPVVNPRPPADNPEIHFSEAHDGGSDRPTVHHCKSAELLHDAVQRGDNTLISGGTGTGKTTIGQYPRQFDFLTRTGISELLRNTAELAIRSHTSLSAEAQLDTHRSKITSTISSKPSSVNRSNAIIIGEVRGGEARTLVDALNTEIGHAGYNPRQQWRWRVSPLLRPWHFAARPTRTRPKIEREITLP